MARNCEIERKFTLPCGLEELEQRLLDKGFAFKSKKVFRDQYFDTYAFSLLYKDHWLRLREGDLELKAPMSGVQVDLSPTDCYEEITDFEIIVNRLFEGLEIPRTEINNETELFDSLNLQCFADITTTRVTYKKDNVSVDLDKTDTGKTLGEIELMYSKEAFVQDEAEGIIAGIANGLGIDLTHVTLGKVHECIKSSYPDVFRVLLEALNKRRKASPST
eukprot:Nk52_evm75s221 gene=Nk52_evmTU75s221